MNEEIERKYLIAYPDTDLLKSRPGCVCWEIVQTYLQSSPGEDVRVRSIIVDGTVSYTYTKKTKKSALARFEEEYDIDPATYAEHLQHTDPAFMPLHKTRYRIPENGQMLEIDIYPQISHWAILEIELAAEDQMPVLPTWLTVLGEVTGDKAYSNRRLAKIEEDT